MSSAKASPTKFLIWKDILALAFRRPWVAIGFIAIQFIVVFVAYSADLEFQEALILAGVFSLLWLIIFIGVPAIWQFILGILTLFLVGGLAYLVYQASDNQGVLNILIALGIGLLLACLILGFLYLMFYLSPGIIVGMTVYQLTDNSTYGIIAMLITTVVLLLIMTFIFRYLLPFLLRFGWTYFSYGLAMQLALLIVLGTGATKLLQDGSSITNHLEDLSSLGQRLVNLLTSLFDMPWLVKAWAIIVSILVGIFFLSPKLLNKR